MIIQDIKSTKEKQKHIINERKHVPASQAISKTMRVRRYNAEHIAQYGRSRATLVATGCHHRVIICPGGRHGHRFRHKKSSCGIVEIAF